MQSANQPDDSADPAPDVLKPPHDASIFVGSLPSNIDQAELTRLLIEHLSGNVGIKNIKVVRDSKGGICAFVQCEDAATASNLLETLQTSPQKPFMGRVLRYEPARAFRTLLISYRIPVQVIGTPCLTGPHAYTHVPLNLPTSMKIWKQRNAKFYSISYNLHPSDVEGAGDPGDDPLGDTVILNPLDFTSDALLTLTSYFGTLESFVPLDPHEPLGGDPADCPPWARYPHPHNAPRSASMEPTCWQVKWQHRNDCVSALMTLRRIPHLTVTWAHQPTSSGYDPRQPNYLYSFPHQWRRTSLFFNQPTRQIYGNSTTSLGSMTQGLEELSLHTSKPPFDFSTTQRSGRQSFPIDNAPSDPVSSDHDVDVISLDPANASAAFNAEVVPHSSPPHTPVMVTRSLGADVNPEPTRNDNIQKAFNHRPQQHERVIDPTTLFVGGLEMFGPRAWNEEKVRKVFSKFGGLDHVKFVRPSNSCAAFAFVKFNNPEAPAKAVAEEHNKVYEGRAIRVQLRDCNPPRGTWKYGRGRGRASHTFFQPHRRFSSKAQNVPPHRDEEVHPDEEPRNNDHGTPKPADESNSTTLVEDTAHSQPSLLLSSSISYSPSDGSNYREWYDPPESSSPTPAPSSLGSSASAIGQSAPPMYAHPMAAPYFPTAAWVHPYLAPAPFPVPYYPGYPMFPPVQHPAQTLPSPPGSDVSGPTTVLPTWPHIGVYGPFVHYPMVQPPPVIGADQAHLPQSNSQASVTIPSDQDIHGHPNFPTSHGVNLAMPPPYTRPQTCHPGVLPPGRTPPGAGLPSIPSQLEAVAQFHTGGLERQAGRRDGGYTNNNRNFRSQRPPKMQPHAGPFGAGQPVPAEWNR